MQDPYLHQSETGKFWDCALALTRWLWKEWPMDMKPRLGDWQQMSFSMSGTCPHCLNKAVFYKVAGDSHQIADTSKGASRNEFRVAAIMRCAGCSEYILGIVMIALPVGTNGQIFYEAHYPVGRPDETVADEVPEHIKPDFREALRCIWVEAYNATAEMCRRALESACIDLGAPKDKVLEKMIDWLESQRKITPYLQEAAHTVRLGGNRGAHPPEDGPSAPSTTNAHAPIAGPVEKIEKEHAEAIVQFTREFFHHVYVGPKLLGKYDFSKPKGEP